MKNLWVIAVLFLTLPAIARETLIIDTDCDTAESCAAVQGSYGKAVATVKGNKFTYIAKPATYTCCQLSTHIKAEICKAELNPKNAEVVCTKR